MAVDVPNWIYDIIKNNRDGAQIAYDTHMQEARNNLAALHNWQAILDDLNQETPQSTGE